MTLYKTEYKNIWTGASGQLVKFLMVGISNTVISYIIFILLFKIFLAGNAFVSQGIGYGAGILWSFYWNKRWTFPKKGENRNPFLLFLLLQLSLLFISAFAIDYFYRLLNVDIHYIWIPITALLTAINFIISKYLVFRA